MGRKIMAEIAMTLPFQIDVYGKVSSTIEQERIWADRVRSVIGTCLRERVMRPNFGTTIPFALFETSDSAIQEVTSEVNNAFLNFLPTLSVQEVTVTFNEPLNTIDVSITYSLPNDKLVTTTIGVVVIRGTLPPIQELT
jgi:phage baseplate assembly protein W